MTNWIQAIKDGDLEAVKGIFPNFCLFQSEKAECNTYPKFALEVASKYGHAHIVQFLLQKKIGPTKRTFMLAAAGGYLDVIELLWDFSHQYGEDAARSAVQFGKLDIIKFLYEKDPNSCEDVMSHAAEQGQLDIIKYLYEHGVPITEQIQKDAIYGGDLETFIWLYTREPFYVKACKVLNSEILEWLNECSLAAENLI
jgi:hypothetical protein